MDLNVNGAYIYFTIPILGGIPITQTTLSLFLVMTIVCIFSVVMGKHLTKRPGKLQVIVEKAIEVLQNLVVESMGAHNVHWTPYIGTIFLSSILGSYIGMTGFLRSSTADLTVVLTWAILTSLIIWYNNIKRNGVLGWLKGFTEPVVVMTPMNIISEIAQPVSMAFRHFGNVIGGSVLTSIIYTALSLASSLLLTLIAKSIAMPLICAAVGIFLLLSGIKKMKKARKTIGIVFLVIAFLGILQYFNVLSGVPILEYGLPAVLSCYFDLFSGFIQAFVFSLLSMVYIGGACPPPEGETEAAN